MFLSLGDGIALEHAVKVLHADVDNNAEVRDLQTVEQ